MTTSACQGWGEAERWRDGEMARWQGGEVEVRGRRDWEGRGGGEIWRAGKER